MKHFNLKLAVSKKPPLMLSVMIWDLLVFFGSRADLVFQSKDSCNSCSKEKSSKEAEIMITSNETIYKMLHTEGGQWHALQDTNVLI